MKKKFVTMALLVSLTLAGCGKEVATQIQQQAPQSKQETKQTKAFDFTLKSLEGETYTLSELQGKKVYLEFWASWCSVCNKSMPEINELAKNPAEDVEILTIVSPNNNGELGIEEFKEWFAEKDYGNVTVLIDESGDTLKNYGIWGYPTSAFIDTSGNLAYMQPGYISKEVIQDTLTSLQ